jgi:hypothetical protein
VGDRRGDNRVSDVSVDISFNGCSVLSCCYTPSGDCVVLISLSLSELLCAYMSVAGHLLS